MGSSGTVFSQEGWRLEHQDLEDALSPVVFKGVVFNEMKGVFVSVMSMQGQCKDIMCIV